MVIKFTHWINRGENVQYLLMMTELIPIYNRNVEVGL